MVFDVMIFTSAKSLGVEHLTLQSIANDIPQ